jgi:uridine kinase
VRDLTPVVKGTARRGRPALVAVDGVDGSGKTTFAHGLAEAYESTGRPVHVVHLDDYLNPRAVRYRLGRGSPEGYLADTYDLDALRTHVLQPLRSRGGGRTIQVRWFDHRADAPVHVDPAAVSDDAVVIVEGMFLHRDDLAKQWDVSVFLDVPFRTSVARMARRDGSDPDPEHPSNHRYVQGQRLYLATCQPHQRATWVIDNS